MSRGHRDSIKWNRKIWYVTGVYEMIWRRVSGLGQQTKSFIKFALKRSVCRIYRQTMKFLLLLLKLCIGFVVQHWDGLTHGMTCKIASWLTIAKVLRRFNFFFVIESRTNTIRNHDALNPERKNTVRVIS